MRTTTIAPRRQLLVSRPDDARNAASALARSASAARPTRTSPTT